VSLCAGERQGCFSLNQGSRSPLIAQIQKNGRSGPVFIEFEGGERGIIKYAIYFTLRAAPSAFKFVPDKLVTNSFGKNLNRKASLCAGEQHGRCS